MKDLSEYLKKFKITLFKNEDTIEIIREIIKTTTSIDLKLNDIYIKDNVVYIKANPLYKNIIFLKKKIILKTLSEKKLLYITELR